MLNKILYPIKAFKASYLSLLAVYFAVGFAGLASVTNTYFIKDLIKLPSDQLIAIGIWAGLPWSIKIIFGSIIDSVKIFGNNRKSYIYLGNALIALGTLGLVDHASTQILISYFGKYVALLLTGLITTIGVVVSDIVADTMAIEVTQDEKELGDIQVLSRLALSIGAVLGAAISGYLADAFKGQYHIVFAMVLICPLISVVGTYLTKTTQQTDTSPLDKKLFLGGLLFGTISIGSGLVSQQYGTLIMFLGSSVLLTFMFKNLLSKMDASVRTAFALSMIAIFLFRVTPGIGPGISWYYIDVLKFDEIFMGHLSLVGNLCALVVLWFLMETVASSNIFKTLLILTVVGTVLSFPDIMIFYGIHDTIGISARSLTILDTAAISPVVNLAMVPLGVIVAKNAPKTQKAAYMTVTAGLMNLALVGGDVMTELLNKVFIIKQGDAANGIAADYSQLGELMLWSLGIGTALSIIGLILLKKGDK